MKSYLLLLPLLCMTACNTNIARSAQTDKDNGAGSLTTTSMAADTTVEICFTDSLTIYYPQYNRIDLVCGNPPEKKDSTVIMMVAGAFTGELLDEFRHSNIAGDHVSNGIFHKGYRCRRNNGAFLFYNGKAHFSHGDYASELSKAAEEGGCAFGQEMMLHRGKEVEHTRKDGNVNVFRALCLINGKVAVADSRRAIRFGNFIKALQEAGATEALYLDMGIGWNYSWYRDPYGRVVEIYPIPTPYSTNWVTFYR